MRLKSFNKSAYSEAVKNNLKFKTASDNLHTAITDLGLTRQRATHLITQDRIYVRTLEAIYEATVPKEQQLPNVDKVAFVKTILAVDFTRLSDCVNIFEALRQYAETPNEEDFKVYYTEEQMKQEKALFELTDTLNEMFEVGIIKNAQSIARGFGNVIKINPYAGNKPFEVR